MSLYKKLKGTMYVYGAGKTLPVADAQEAWVVEMAFSSEGTGGLWVIQCVPEGEFFISANKFRIREITSGNPDIYMEKHFVML